MVYVEKEITLVIFSEESDIISDEIINLNELAGYLLTEPEFQDIRDISFDTADKSLLQHHMSLRIREINRKCLFTLKSNPEFDQSGVVKRNELELEWQSKSFDILIDALVKSGVELPENTAFDLDWYEGMGSLGMMILQERHTIRFVKNIICKEELLAELAVDEVKYKFQDGDIVHREIEIESKSAYGDSIISIISKHLMQRYPSDLSIWMPSKLELGLALQDLIESGNRDILENGEIGQKLYSKIDDYCKGKSEFI